MKYSPFKTLGVLLLLAGSFVPAFGQIVSFQSRYVPDENIQEFINRETTYWSVVADKAIKESKMVRWELWRRESGMGINDGANFLFVNEFKRLRDVDRMPVIWDHTKVFPDLALSEIETGSLSRIVDQVFLSSQVSLLKTRPNFIRINFARASDLGRYLELENIVWQDFVKERMDANQTNVVSWDLMRVMSPGGVDRAYDAITIDGFAKLSHALKPDFGDNAEYPDFEQFRAVHEKRGNSDIFSREGRWRTGIGVRNC